MTSTHPGGFHQFVTWSHNRLAMEVCAIRRSARDSRRKRTVGPRRLASVHNGQAAGLVTVRRGVSLRATS
jgi:hypothetical protein